MSFSKEKKWAVFSRCSERLRLARTSSVIGCVAAAVASAAAAGVLGDSVVVLFTVHWNRLFRKPCLELSAMKWNQWNLQQERRMPYMRESVLPFTVMLTIGTNSDSFEKPPLINRYRQHTMKLICKHRSEHFSAQCKPKLGTRWQCSPIAKSAVHSHVQVFSLISASATKHVLIQLKHLLDHWRNPLGREKKKELWPHDGARKYGNEAMD